MKCLTGLCFAALCWPALAVMTKVLFSNETMTSYGSRCLDGSPAGYYYEAGSGSGATSWAIFLEGGGACYLNTGTSDVNCFVRAKSPLGSSHYWAGTYTDNGNVLDTNPSINPDFANWHHVYVPYCGGDVHTGTRKTVVNTDYPFYFSGHLIIQAVVDMLINTTGIAQADAVLLSGSSAGGIGTFANADYVASRLPAVPLLRASPQGGWFFPHTVNYTSFQSGNIGPPYAGTTPTIEGLWQTLLHPACVAANPTDPSYCGSVGNFYPYITTPMYVIENQADSNQIFAQEGCPVAKTPAVEQYIQYYISAMRASVQQVYNKSTAGGVSDGLFFPNCVAHTGNTGLGGGAVVANTTYTESLGAWFFNRNNGVARQVADSCLPYDCNPHGCPPLPSAPTMRSSLPKLTF